MAGQFLESVGDFTSGDYVKGVNEVAQQLVYSGGGGSRAGLVNAVDFVPCIVVSEDGLAIVRLPTSASANTANYALLAGTTDAQVGLSLAFPNKHKILFQSTATDTEYYHYDNGGTFPYNGGVQTPDDYCGNYDAAPWSLGVNTSELALAYTANPTAGVDGSKPNVVLALIDNESILVSSPNGAVVRVLSIRSTNSFNITLLDSTTSGELQTEFQYPNRFRTIYKDVDVDSEWTYYNAGGAYPFTAPAAGPVAAVTRQAVEVIAPMVPVAVAQVTRQAVEVIAPMIAVAVGAVSRQVIEVISSVAVVVNQGDGTTIKTMEGFGTIRNDSTDLLALGWDQAGGTRVTTQGRFGGTGYSLAAGAVLASLEGALATEARWGVTYWAQWATISGPSVIYHLSGDTITSAMATTTTAHTAVILNADGSLALYADNVLIGTTAIGIIVATSWHHIEVRTFIDVAGSVELWVDEVSLLSATGINTIAGANAATVAIQIGAGTSATCVLDDVLISQLSVARMKYHQIHDLGVTGAGTNAAWTGTFADVDDAPGTTDEDTTYISTEAAGRHDHAFADIPLGLTIHAVELLTRARVAEGATITLAPYVLIGATPYDFANAAVIATYVDRIDRLNDDPDTSTNWTEGAVNGLIGGTISTL